MHRTFELMLLGGFASPPRGGRVAAADRAARARLPGSRRALARPSLRQRVPLARCSEARAAASLRTPSGGCRRPARSCSTPTRGGWDLASPRVDYRERSAGHRRAFSRASRRPGRARRAVPPRRAAAGLVRRLDRVRGALPSFPAPGRWSASTTPRGPPPLCRGRRGRSRRGDVGPAAGTAHRALIRVFLAEGNAFEAVRQFRLCRALTLRHWGPNRRRRPRASSAISRPGSRRDAAPPVTSATRRGRPGTSTP